MNIINKHVEIGLIILGAWPGMKISAKFLVYYIIYISTALVFQVWDIPLVYLRMDLLMLNLSKSVPVLSALLKIIIFSVKMGKIRKLVQEMLDDWKNKGNDDCEVMTKNVKLANTISFAMLICYNGLIFSYFGSAILSYFTGPVEQRKFVLQSSFPIDARKSPIFEIICLSQFIFVLHTVNEHAMIEELLTISVLHLHTKAFGVCQEILKFSDTCLNSKDSKLVSEAKMKLIDKHLNFISFAKNIQDIFSYIAFFHLFLMTLCYCFVGYMLISIKTFNKENLMLLLMGIAYMLTLLLSVGAYCVAGEYVKIQDSWIFEEMLSIPWYEFKPTDMQTIYFILMKRDPPIALTLGHFSDLSLLYFSQIIKTSFSYLSLIRAASN